MAGHEKHEKAQNFPFVVFVAIQTSRLPNYTSWAEASLQAIFTTASVRDSVEESKCNDSF